MRTNPTPAERLIWQRLRHHHPAFTRQLVVDWFIVDLACRRARLAVEFDGSQHDQACVYDEKRSDHLRMKGWRVIRLWNSDVLTNPDGASMHILDIAAECLGGTHPQPLPCREGSRRNQRRRSP